MLLPVTLTIRANVKLTSVVRALRMVSSELEQRGCGRKLGLLGGSSCIHTKIEFEPSSSTSSSESVLQRPFDGWA
ncbi:MAG: hypothetical protein WAW69_14070, partial [Polaromonas sp.]